MISAADKALYHAKKSDRNCIASHSDAIAELEPVTLYVAQEPESS